MRKLSTNWASRSSSRGQGIGFEEKHPERGGRGSKGGHVSVLSKEAIDFLDPKRGGVYIDATLGLGGHGPEDAKPFGRQGRVITFDKATNAMDTASNRLTIPPEELKDDWPEIT